MNKLAICLTLIASCVFYSNRPLIAEEPAEEFLEALAEAEYHDIALDYLTSLETGNIISAEFRKILPFKKATALISSAEDMPASEVNLVVERLDEAQNLLTQYASTGDKTLETLSETLRYQGGLYYRRSRVFLFQGSDERLTAAEKNEFNVKARTMLEGALKSYQDAKAKTRSLIDPNSAEGIKIDVEDPSTSKKLKRFKAIYTQIRVRIPMVIEQIADTWPDTAPERAKRLTEASKEYNNVYNDYNQKYISGLEAKVYEARCFQKMGKHNEALHALEDIFNLSSNAVYNRVKKMAFLQGTESWAKVESYPHSEIVARLEPVVELLNRNEVREPDWLKIQMELAVALHKEAEAIKAKGGPTANRDARAIDNKGAKILKSVSRIPSEYRDPARALLEEWDVKIVVDAATDEMPESFSDARQKASDSLGEIQTLFTDASRLQREVKAAGENPQPDKVAELEETTEMLESQTNSTLQLLELALELADDQTDRDEINNVRFQQSFCYFAMSRHFESALIGEFLLSKYPTVDGTRQATNLMIKSYSQLNQEAGKDNQFERDRLTNACVTVVKRWPGSDEAGNAARTMTELAIAEKDYPLAEEYFGKIPEDASYRPYLAASLGRRLMFSASDGTPEQKQESLNKTIQYLEIGANPKGEDVNYQAAMSALLLSNAYLDAGQVDKAVQQLESAPVAPLDLVKQKHPALSQAGSPATYTREAYRIAINAYLAAMGTGSDQQKWVDKASGIIAALRQDMEASNDPDARKRVTQIYGRIANALKEQFEALKSVDEKKKFASSLASFLGSIEKDSKDSKTILWAGSTLLGTADSLKQSGADVEATQLFQQAVGALNRAEKLGFEGDEQQAAMEIELKRQRALAQRGSGKFDDAVKQFIEILKANPKSLLDQVLVAETLQMRATANNREQGYVEAMMGMQKTQDPKTKRSSNLVWGWYKLFMATRGNEKFKDRFIQATFHMAECRFEYGLLLDDTNKKQKAIDSAAKLIEDARKKDPGLGGPAWNQKFKDLEQRIKTGQ